MNSYTQPHFDRSALITIDTQNDFTLAGAPLEIPGTSAVIPNMVRLLEVYRKKGLAIVHVVRLYLVDGSNAELCRRTGIEEGRTAVAPDTEGAELVTELKPDPSLRLNAQLLLAGGVQTIGPNEYLIFKPRWGAFYQTELEAFLRQKGCDTLVFCGCNYPNCPRTSIYEASERDFRIVLATDALSRLYKQGADELRAIGVALMSTQEIMRELA